MKQYVVKTLGCKANLYDSQIIESELQKRGWTPFTRAEGSLLSEDVGLCIINSCSVTDEADRQTRKLAKKLAQENPHSRVIVTGCGAEIDPETLAQSPGVHFVIGNQNKDQLIDLVLGAVEQKNDVAITSDIQSSKLLGTVKTYKELQSKHPVDREWPALIDSFLTPPVHLEGHSDKTRSFLKIQEGCNSFCTYCIIPYGRGPSRSIRPREIIQQVRELVSQGVREVVLTGTNIGDYGLDWSNTPVLGDLIQLILDETSLERLRVSSLDPTEVTPQIFELMRNSPRFCAHFHISLQSPSSKILRLMKRRYSYDEVKACLEKIAALPAPLGGVFVGMDVITGFPGESEEDFEWTYQALSELPWARLHVFPYSERKGTPATRLPNSVPQSVRVQRAKRLNELSMKRLVSHYQRVLDACKGTKDSVSSVLLEKATPGWNWIPGYSSNYLRVLIDSKTISAQRNEVVSIQPLDLMIDSKGNDVALISKIIPSVHE
ncbi:tRNA (N(6)-L-threonylcarbamoyladenosine(37)-C(2))-methylthiotransferase MtaB [bacterium]|jgi:threonylcarbamoyladenosine tRNA methylthiotransferase MtaB|nr:tRNA (N(6)-L-threonylcarbamoyladenosine(37)-C(2))-methylthiotransferase MtaB [bacterium]